jgi:hypothetical protein
LRAEPKGALRYFVRSTVLFVTRAFPRIHLREILGRGTPCYTTIVLSKYVRGAERDPDSMEPRQISLQEILKLASWFEEMRVIGRAAIKVSDYR